MTHSRETKPHIGILGRCNVGKSSLINALSGQDIAMVSDIAGTTTDNVKKTMEIKGLGAIVLIDTAGIDDNSQLGGERVRRTMETLALIDLAVLVITHNEFAKPEEDIVQACIGYGIPYIMVSNKADLCPLSQNLKREIEKTYSHSLIPICANNKTDIENLTLQICKAIPSAAFQARGILNGIVKPQDIVVLVTPVDCAAPEGRIILPQVQLIRSVLDNDAINIVVKETELQYALAKLCCKPTLVITDSQVFEFVSGIVPEDIPLTSFSIVLARHKGCFEQYVAGTPFLDRLRDGNRLLILESCSHQPTCEDIGREKLPAWIRKYTGKSLIFDVVAGLSRIERPITDYAMVIQCGGCMITARQLRSRLLPALEKGVPVSNYGLAIAYMNGIFARATSVFNNH